MSSPMFDLPVHLQMGLTADGRGPVDPEHDEDFDHFGCWCGDPDCRKWER